ncbi:MAG: efflux transporter outer membrane subunit [Akkermansiaceae bacterium]|nr:efflux transporter outer membrane subunit [Akkermansiaceae bacterium]
MKPWAAGWTAAVLAGCAPAPAPESRVSAVASMAPDAWAASREARAGVDRDWIERFGDRRLSRLVGVATTNSYNLRAAEERLRRAAAVARQAGAALKPQMDASLHGSRSEQKFVGFPFGAGGIPSSISNSFGASLDVNWELDVWGRLRAGQAAAIADAQAQAADLAAARTSLASQIAKAWFAAAEAAEQVALAETELKVRKDTVEAVRGRFELALFEEGGSASQLRLVETELSTARANLAFWEGERERVRRQLDILAGRYPDGSQAGPGTLPRIPSQPPAGLPSELLLRRPDILAAERRFAAAGRRERAAHLARFPSFALTGSLGTTTNRLREVLDSDFGVWSMGAGVAAPILDGRRLLEGERIARSDERQALAVLQQTVLDAFGEVEQALVADRFLARRIDALEEATRLSADASLAAGEDYVGGSGDVLTLLSAQSRRIQAASQLVTVRRLRLDNRINLHLALGGDFRPRGK